MAIQSFYGVNNPIGVRLCEVNFTVLPLINELNNFELRGFSFANIPVEDILAMFLDVADLELILLLCFLGENDGFDDPGLFQFLYLPCHRVVYCSSFICGVIFSSW